MVGDERGQPHEAITPARASPAVARRTLPSARYDLAIIGGGSAGLPAAELAAALGARVALLDRERLGGECLYTGCVPSKALLHIARVAAHTRAARRLGLSADLGPVDLGAVADHVRAVIAEVYTTSDAPEHYEARGVAVALGEVRFVGPDRLAVNGQTVHATHYVICTGSRPMIPPIPGLAEAGYLTNETVFDQRRLPASLAIIGGGPVGCELGQAFARLGARVAILQRAERLLMRDEPEAAQVLRARLEDEGVTIHTGVQIDRVTRRAHDGLKTVAFTTRDGQSTIAAEELLVAVGRAPNVDGLGLDDAAVAHDTRRGIHVDPYLRTSNPRVYAAGDVTGGYRFTHAAALQARTAVRNALFPGRAKLDERAMPWATFTEPEVAHVGMTEEEARHRYGNRIRVFTQPFRHVDRAIIDGAPEGFVKLVTKRDGALLGGHIVGPGAGDHINELALALRQELGLAQLAGTTHVYPTLALAIQRAAGIYTLDKAVRGRTNRLLRRLTR